MQQHFMQIDRQVQTQTIHIKNSRKNNENHIKVSRLL